MKNRLTNFERELVRQHPGLRLTADGMLPAWCYEAALLADIGMGKVDVNRAHHQTLPSGQPPQGIPAAE